MATNLRDLEADRRLVDRFREIRGSDWTTSEKDILTNIADSALDEIERLKRLLVRRWPAGGFIVMAVMLDESCGGTAMHSSQGFEGWWFETEADAWAAVRKAAMNGKT